MSQKDENPSTQFALITPFHNKLSDKKYFYEIYTLDQPLQPGETMRMDFHVSRHTKGFSDGGERPELAYNGTFFDRDYFPSLGYSQQIELDDPVRRREEKLGELRKWRHAAILIIRT